MRAMKRREQEQEQLDPDDSIRTPQRRQRVTTKVGRRIWMGRLTCRPVFGTNSYMRGKPKSYKSMTDALRREIAGSELSFRALETATGLTRQSLMKFAAGEQSLRLDLADALAEHFGLVVLGRKQ